MNMDEKNEIIVFENKRIRRIFYNGKWYFAIIDIIFALTDSINPRGYLKDMRRRDDSLNKGWGQIATPLLVGTPGGKQLINCANKQGIFRIIQSIPSKRAEPFKLWLAKVGSDRIDEIENPELAQERMKELYEKKGYSKNWIDKRLRGIAIRQDLTDEWKKRGIEEQSDFAILTAEISKASFGMTPNEYKKFKGLQNENLRDHMNDLELIFSMLGEASTAEIERTQNPEKFEEHINVSRKGGEIASNARKELEQETRESVISEENYLSEKEKDVREKKSKRNLIKIGDGK
jgi:hypothetical protein